MKNPFHQEEGVELQWVKIGLEGVPLDGVKIVM